MLAEWVWQEHGLQIAEVNMSEGEEYNSYIGSSLGDDGTISQGKLSD